MKTAIVYDRVNKFGGAERVLLTLHELFPDAPLYTSVYSPEKASWAAAFPRIFTSFLNKFKFLRNSHEILSVFMPLAFEQFSFDKYDLMISVSSEAAKGIITKPHTRHICYCLTPTRYLYSGHHEYENNPPGILGLIPFYKVLSKPFIGYMKIWDNVAAQRPDEMVAISNAVNTRIEKYYGRDSSVIFPPVDIERFRKSIRSIGKVSKKGDYYLMVGRIEPYKKVELAIKVFIKIKRTLVIAGTGSQELALRNKYSSNKNIIFKGFADDDEVVTLFKSAKAFIFPQEEDFGITAVEAQASGCPVIAYRKGGSSDTIIDGETGIFFDEQNEESMIDAIKKFDRMRFEKEKLYKNAVRFDKNRFKKEIMDLINKTV